MLLAPVLVLGFGVGGLLGLLGAGGSLLTLPLLTEYLGLDPHRAAATSLVVVGATALAGLVAHARAARVDFRAGALFGGAGLVGASGGGFVGGHLPASAVLMAFSALLLVAAATLLLDPPPPTGAAPSRGRRVARGLAAGAGVGFVGGLVGAGGGFLVVPALVYLGRLPLPRAIGTSLLVVVLNALGGILGYSTHLDLDWQLAGALSAAMVLGSLAGARLTGDLSRETLRRGFATLLLVVGAALLWRHLPGGPL